ncbi:hypothetical protein P8C59_001377 [Phyllachora maydis]|uniref:Ergothioneine biosynthesis protein 1 n=1 Tax=Phyllachora maydis TaxID=1825666 RepID=A0AAD9HZJ3_9PEZI|nr:hypothetical protein P8C59_001377 [Phyllachora maydis]
MGDLIRPHDRILIEISMKYSREEAERLWNLSGLVEVDRWSRNEEYAIHKLCKPKMPFHLIPAKYAGSPLPALEDWEALWETWDTVSQRMMPDEELLAKPIKLRNACIFYLGHIPTFLDLQLTKTTGAAPTEPAAYAAIFERGIDPDVDNPELCHAHSEMPDEWPPVAEILAYQDRVRARLRGLYADGVAERLPRPVGQAVWAGFEHEAMHLETLLYMMLQSDRTLPPPHAARPDFEKLAARAEAARVPNPWFDIPAQIITIGMDDPEDGTDPNLHYGWDNEKPARQVRVHAFQAQGRPMTNEEYAQYMCDKHIADLPASWAHALEKDGHQAPVTTNGNANGANGHANGHAAGVPESFLDDKAVRTVYGLVPLRHALDWPIFASYDELTGCAAYMGGRIPTLEEARSIYAHVDVLKKDEAEKQLGKMVPAVNGHLSHNGVHQTPPPGSSTAAAPVSAAHATTETLFADLDGANVGFQHWHPVAVTGRRARPAGQAELGGVWEWTSSALEAHDGFAPMRLYPGYTADFFDGKHNVVLGGSWATHPRIAGRKSFVNWYQRKYPYAWVGARLVRDLD